MSVPTEPYFIDLNSNNTVILTKRRYEGLELNEEERDGLKKEGLERERLETQDLRGYSLLSPAQETDFTVPPAVVFLKL